MGREIVVDNFAGGGGASEGIERALGRPIDFAINHDAEAIAMHRVNHPHTHHFCESVWDVNPRQLAPGRAMGLGWFSPDCTYHSKARGGKPFRDRNKARRVRGLAWLVHRWVDARRPRVIMLENVEEFADWGPLLKSGRPDPKRRGATFRKWHRQLENAGYQVDMRILKACDYGAPTTRKRLFVIARCDGEEIVFPEAVCGPGAAPYRTAAECIDWSLPCPSIFTRDRPLAEATLRRIARGVMRYVVDDPQPFIVGIDNKSNGTRDAWGAVVAAFLAKHYGGHETPGTSAAVPFDTITARDHHALVSSHVVKLRHHSTGQDMREPLHAIAAGGTHFGEVRAFLMKYYSPNDRSNQRLDAPLQTIRTKDCFGLVTVKGTRYAIVDIGMRMLSPRELYRAQGFGDHYQIAPEVNGKPLTKEAQVRMVGNSVPPPVAEQLVLANVVNREARRARVA